MGTTTDMHIPYHHYHYSLINALKPGAIPSIGTHHSAFVKASISLCANSMPTTRNQEGKKGDKRGRERYVLKKGEHPLVGKEEGLDGCKRSIS